MQQLLAGVLLHAHRMSNVFVKCRMPQQYRFCHWIATSPCILLFIVSLSLYLSLSFSLSLTLSISCHWSLSEREKKYCAFFVCLLCGDDDLRMSINRWIIFFFSISISRGIRWAFGFEYYLLHMWSFPLLMDNVWTFLFLDTYTSGNQTRITAWNGILFYDFCYNIGHDAVNQKLCKNFGRGTSLGVILECITFKSNSVHFPKPVMTVWTALCDCHLNTCHIPTKVLWGYPNGRKWNEFFKTVTKHRENRLQIWFSSIYQSFSSKLNSTLEEVYHVYFKVSIATWDMGSLAVYLLIFA